MLAASRVAHFGAGMLGTDAGHAALAAWAQTVADALDASGDWSVAMPEPGGLSLDTATASVRAIREAGPVVGFGATAVLIGRGGDADVTLDAVTALAEAALGR